MVHMWTMAVTKGLKYEAMRSHHFVKSAQFEEWIFFVLVKVKKKVKVLLNWGETDLRNHMSSLFKLQ